jgi:hypothetical protein
MIPLARLEKELKAMTFPEQVRISKCELITNVPQMIAGHLKTLKGNPGNRVVLCHIMTGCYCLDLQLIQNE